MKKLTDKIADYLFKDGSGRTVRRLVMEYDGDTFAQGRGGWCREAVRDAVQVKLDEAKPDAGHRWTLDVKYEGAWQTFVEKPSADACKAEARSLRNNYLTGEPAFRLYDPLGRLYAVSYDNDSWRMKWKPGNMLTREQQAA